MRIAILLYIFSANLFASVIEITGVDHTEIDFVFSLRNREPKTEVILDCASFFHNLEVLNVSKRLTYYLSAQECWDIYRALKAMNRRMCLIYNPESFFLRNCK